MNGGYSSEYISQELKDAFLDNRKKVKSEEQILVDFFNKFTFERKSYQVILGINADFKTYKRYNS